MKTLKELQKEFHDWEQEYYACSLRKGKKDKELKRKLFLILFFILENLALLIIVAKLY